MSFVKVFPHPVGAARALEDYLAPTGCEKEPTGEAEAKMRVLICYKGEKRFKVLEAHSLECTPYPEAGRVVVELNTPTGSVFLEAEGNAEKLVEDILEDLLSEDKYVVQVAVKSVVRERWGE